MKDVLYIVWREANELGIPIIDEQHRGIVSTINSLFYFIREKRELDALKPTLIILEQYTKLHFQTEEAIMKEAGFPGLDAHVSLHQKLTKQTAALVRNPFAEGGADTVLSFLKNWWLNHINQEDRGFVPYVQRRAG